MKLGVNSIDIKKSRDSFRARFRAETQANFSTVFSILHLGPIFGPIFGHKFMSIELTPWVGLTWIRDVSLSCLGSTAAAVQPNGL